MWVGDWSQFLLFQLLDGLLLVPEIQLGANQDDGCRGAVVPHLRVPLEGTYEQEDVRGIVRYSVIQDLV